MGIKNTEFFKDENGVEMRKDIYDNGMTITQIANPPEPEPQPEPIPSQLDRIEAAVNAKNEEIVQAAIDNYTLELMEGGLL